VRLIFNLLWCLLGGFWMAMGWCFVGAIAFLTIVGIPWAKACFVMGQLSLFPFGHEVVSRKELSGREDLGTGPFGLAGNVVWFVLGGFWLALGHLISALVCFVTIIGIPFGLQHLKLARLALAPIGKTIVPKEAVALWRQRELAL
jgi:uncharacterized membrane protein YccF (DUF307 family)